MNRRRALALVSMLAPLRTSLSQGRKVRLGLLLLAPAAANTAGPLPDLVHEFLAALGRLGWMSGQNLAFESRVTAAEPHRAVDMAKDLLQGGAELLVAVGSSNALAARGATSTAPIVMLASGYPVESGLARSLARPGGNVTGLRIYAGEVFGKYVELAKELVPSLKQLGVFWGYGPPAFPEIETRLGLDEMQRSADRLGIRLQIWQNPDSGKIAANLREAADAPIQALFVTSGTAQAVPQNVREIARFCEARRLPTMCDVAGIFFQTGGLVAYSFDTMELAVRGAAFVDRILRGAKPGDLPIEQPTRFILIVNAKRAGELGVSVPASLIARADRVIE